MRVMIQFVRAMLKMPWPWLAWILALMIVNLFAPILFIGSLEGKMVLAAFALGVVLQVAIFSSKGFVRLLGLGHVGWIPLVFWLVSRLEMAPSGIAHYWIVAVLVVNSTSLLIDTVDVVRYLHGERTPQLEV